MSGFSINCGELVEIFDLMLSPLKKKIPTNHTISRDVLHIRRDVT